MKSIAKQLGLLHGGEWSYQAPATWLCSDGRRANRTCSCADDSDTCRCGKIMWIYEDNKSPIMFCPHRKTKLRK